MRLFISAFSALAFTFLLSSCATTRGPDTQTQAEIEPAATASTIRVGLAQLNSLDTADWTVIEAYIAEAQANGAQFIVFPEGSLFGWLNPEVFYDAETVPNGATAILSGYAQSYGVSIVFGMAEQGPLVPNTNPVVHQAYDAAVLIDTTGAIVINSRKYQVLKNAFDPSGCPEALKDPVSGSCSYYSSPAEDIPVIQTAFGATAVLVCADAYTSDTTALDHVKSLGVETIFVVWGVAAASTGNCGQQYFNATQYASNAAVYTGATVIGANAVGNRPYGRFLPSVYCGYSGIVQGDGTVVATTGLDAGVYFYDVPVGQ